MLVAPVVFFTVVTGVAKFGDLRRLGRVGLKSILYFEAVTTLALVIGLLAATLMQPGRGINADPASLDTSPSRNTLPAPFTLERLIFF